MSASVHSICAIVVLVGTVTSSLGMHIADAGDDVILSSDECLRCKLAILDGARISCERCFLQPSERIYDFSERRQPTTCCRLFGTSAPCCRRTYEGRFTNNDDLDYEQLVDAEREQIGQGLAKRGYETSFMPLDEGPHGTGQCACCGTPRALFNYACCTYNCYRK